MAECFFHWRDSFSPELTEVRLYKKSADGTETLIETFTTRPGPNKMYHYYYDSYSETSDYYVIGYKGADIDKKIILKPDIPEVENLVRVYGKSLSRRRFRVVFHLEPFKEGLTFMFSRAILDQRKSFSSLVDDYGNFWVDLFPNNLIEPRDLSYYRVEMEDADTGRIVNFPWKKVVVSSTNGRVQSFTSLISLL